MESNLENRAGRRTALVLAAALVALAGFSLYLGVERIFQVDEVQFGFEARLLAMGRKDLLAFGAPTILLGPLTWLAGSARSGADVLVRLRLPFVALMWVNFLLMVKCAGIRLRSRAGLWALFLAATLAPVWDYGFEIRHDVVLVTGVLALFSLVRAEGRSEPMRFALIGFLVTFLQFIAFKAFLFSVPLLVAALVLAWLRGRRAWVALLCALVAGLVGGLAVGRLLHGLAGTWSIFLGNQGSSVQAAAQVERFSFWPTAGRMLAEAPLLTCAGLAALAAPLRGRWDLILRSEALPEWIYAATSLVMLVVNPTPFPYNLLHVVPPLYLLVMRYRNQFQAALAALSAEGRVLLSGLLLLLQLLPWGVATWRHVDMDNGRQRQLIALAEQLTDPAHDRVFDGAGLVSTREPVGPHWLVHTFTASAFADGGWTPLREELAAKPTPVILVSYRIAMLPQADRNFMSSHYLPLANDILVLGCLRDSGVFDWEALAEGRYDLAVVPPDGAPSAVRVDGEPLLPGIHTFKRGPHHFEAAAGSKVQVVWIGPGSSGLPNPGPPPSPLFVNWY